MSKSKLVGVILGTLVVAPIWYCMLLVTQATELMWFLFYIYVPVALLVGVLMKITED